jgi:hypothetical protein
MSDLVVQLGAKLDKFNADMNEAGDIADRAVSDIESKFANLNPTMGGFSTLGVAAAGVTGIVGSLLTSLVKVNGELADLQRNAEYAGVTAERFQRIQYAAGQGGVTSTESAEDIRNVARLLADAKENENSLTRLLDANNIKYKDRNGQVIKLNDLLTIAGNLLGKFDSMPEKVKAAQMLGLSERWVEALRNGSGAFEEVAANAEKTGAIIDDATVAKAALFDKAWNQSSVNLAVQFKSVAADIGGWLDGLIDKANDLLSATLAAQGVGAGTGQEKFDSYADALEIVRKDMQGVAQDADQVSRVIERMKNSGKGDPEIVAGLELIHAKAELARQMLLQLNQQQAQTLFPDGVPLPKSRPASADDADPNAAKLPVRGGGGGSQDAFDRASESIAKHTARIEADTLAAGKGKAAQEELRAETQLFAAAQQAGIPITDKMRDKIQDLAQDAGEAAQALAKAKVVADTDFGLKTAFLTQEDADIARQLKDIYGNDIPAALNSTEAAAIRSTNALRTISSIGQDVNRSFLTEFGQQMRNGASAMDAFRTAGLNALGRIADKLTSMAADGLWRAAFGGAGGGLLNLFGLGGASSLTAGASWSSGLGAGTGGLSFPMFAGGTDYAPGGLALIGENGPELLNVPRGSQIVPNDVLRSRADSSSMSVVYNVDASGADPAAIARLERVLDAHTRQIAGQAKTITSAQRYQSTGVM